MLIGVGAYVSVGLGYNGNIPAGVAKLAGGFIVFAVVAHLAVRFLAPYADPVLLPLVICSTASGWR